jgi:SAM-dependent methyltransferase
MPTAANKKSNSKSDKVADIVTDDDKPTSLASPKADNMIRWHEGGLACSAHWRSEAGLTPHQRVEAADEQMSANTAYQLASQGTALLWRGDFQNAKQLLLAIARRVDAKSRPRDAKKADAGATTKNSKSAMPKSPAKKETALTPTEAFHRHRLAQSQRARTLGMLLIPLAGDYTVLLRRAPDLQRACIEVWGLPGSDGNTGDSVVSLRELLGLIGAHEWRKKGVLVPVLEDRVHPHYGVFAPIRSEYVALIAETPFPPAHVTSARNPTIPLAFDIGTGTGVLAAVLAKRGVKQVVATDMDSRAITCARENIKRLKLVAQVQVVEANLFPNSHGGKAPLIVCNPPWIPARPSAPIENAIYDHEGQMLRGFVLGLAAHLLPGGEGWLILSDIAEHLGLRSRDELLALFAEGGLVVIEKRDVKPTHPRVADTDDPLHAARAAEVTSLWRLGVATS